MTGLPRAAHRGDTIIGAHLHTPGNPVPVSPHLVLPITLLERMPPEWQQHLVALLAALRNAVPEAPWPAAYYAQALRPERLTDLDERQLAGVGVTVDLDSDGTLTHRDDRTGQRIPNPEQIRVWVPCPDPLA